MEARPVTSPTHSQVSGLRFLLDPPGEPAANMARDEELADRVRYAKAPPTFRIYRWDQPAISLGRRQHPDELPLELLKKGLPMVHRSTGGGAVIHRLDELTYSVALPRKPVSDTLTPRQIPGILHQRLRDELVNRGLVSADELTVVPIRSQRCQTPSVSGTLCFSAPVCGDLLYHGKKVAGSALRVWREAVLVQGSIQGLPVPFSLLQEIFISSVARTSEIPWQLQPLKLSN